MLFLFHGLHRMYHCLHDVGIHVGAGLKAVFHGLAGLGTLAAVVLLLRIGFGG
jgi:fumarate reductase subunit D